MWRFEHRHWTTDLYFLRAAFDLGNAGQLTDKICIDGNKFYVEFWQYRMLDYNKSFIYLPFYINDKEIIIAANVT